MDKAMNKNILSPESRGNCAKAIEITPELILSLIQIDDSVTIEGKRLSFSRDVIPGSAVALRCGITERGNIMMIIVDESFPFVAEGEEIERMDIQYTLE